MTDAVTANAAPVSTPAPEPVVAPVATTPAPAPKAETPNTEPAIVPVVYEETGDPGTDLALQFVGRLGIAHDHPAMLAAYEGNFDLIKGHLSALGDKAKGWEQYVALAEKSQGESKKAEEATKATVAKVVHETVGGQAEWAAIQAWASQKAEPAEKEQINAMMAAGPFQARAAAMLLKSLYDNAPGIVRTPADPTNKGASSKGVPAANAALTRREAVAETNKLVGKHGSYNIEQRPEYKAIWARVRR